MDRNTPTADTHLYIHRSTRRTRAAILTTRSTRSAPAPHCYRRRPREEEGACFCATTASGRAARPCRLMPLPSLRLRSLPRRLRSTEDTAQKERERERDLLGPLYLGVHDLHGDFFFLYLSLSITTRVPRVKYEWGALGVGKDRVVCWTDLQWTKRNQWVPPATLSPPPPGTQFADGRIFPLPVP